MWLNLRGGKMKRILRFDWLPVRARWAHLARSGFPCWFRKKMFSFWPYDKSLIDQAFLVKMAEYWLRSFLRFYWPRLKFGQYPESYLDLTLGKYRIYDRNQLAILPSDSWQKRKYPLLPLLIPLHCQSQEKQLWIPTCEFTYESGRKVTLTFVWMLVASTIQMQSLQQ